MFPPWRGRWVIYRQGGSLSTGSDPTMFACADGKVAPVFLSADQVRCDVRLFGASRTRRRGQGCRASSRRHRRAGGCDRHGIAPPARLVKARSIRSVRPRAEKQRVSARRSCRDRLWARRAELQQGEHFGQINQPLGLEAFCGGQRETLILPVEQLSESLLYPCRETKLAEVTGGMEAKLDGL